MNLNQQIREQRRLMAWSQDELAERLYVSRQTISNWETGKSCPDIQSLLLMSSIFDISLDTLVKGDLVQMKEIIDGSVIGEMKRLGVVLTMLMAIMILSAVPLMYYLGWLGVALWAVIVAVTLAVAWRVERLKKTNDVQTYREIVAFMEGEKLDEIQQAKESGKRVYEKVALVLLFVVIAAVAVAMMILLFVL